ncbi:hypothetical protein F5887DRAFT_1072927 [Amanita rubescens]|nr:hypothetical protein F5887DRAFT_1072927 [Amanita rubescens]
MSLFRARSSPGGVSGMRRVPRDDAYNPLNAIQLRPQIQRYRGLLEKQLYARHDIEPSTTVKADAIFVPPPARKVSGSTLPMLSEFQDIKAPVKRPEEPGIRHYTGLIHYHHCPPRHQSSRSGPPNPTTPTTSASFSSVSSLNSTSTPSTSTPTTNSTTPLPQNRQKI